MEHQKNLHKDGDTNKQHKTQTLLEGHYDEQASAASFQQALQDWRNNAKSAMTMGNVESLIHANTGEGRILPINNVIT